MIPILFKHGYHIKKHAPQFELLDLYLFQSKAVLCKAAMLLFGPRPIDSALSPSPSLSLLGPGRNFALSVFPNLTVSIHEPISDESVTRSVVIEFSSHKKINQHSNPSDPRLVDRSIDRSIDWLLR